MEPIEEESTDNEQYASSGYESPEVAVGTIILSDLQELRRENRELKNQNDTDQDAEEREADEINQLIDEKRRSASTQDQTQLSVIQSEGSNEDDGDDIPQVDLGLNQKSGKKDPFSF